MGGFFKKLGIHKMDEMEKSIVQKAQRNALIYVTLALMAWTFYESYNVHARHTPINLVPCFLLITTGLVQSFSQLYLQRKAVKGDEEYAKANPFSKIVVIIAIIAGVIASVGAWLMLVGQ